MTIIAISLGNTSISLFPYRISYIWTKKWKCYFERHLIKAPTTYFFLQLYCKFQSNIMHKVFALVRRWSFFTMKTLQGLPYLDSLIGNKYIVLFWITYPRVRYPKENQYIYLNFSFELVWKSNMEVVTCKKGRFKEVSTIL